MGDRPDFPLNDLRKLMDPEFVNSWKIETIKLLRRMTGEGLKEAKNFLEDEWIPFVNSTQTPVPKMVHSEMEFDALVQQVQQLAQEVNNLKAAQTKQTAKGIFNND